MNCKFSVNLNKIALVRNARGRDYPSVEYFARKALAVGAHGVTIHPRPDQRHARYSDISALKQLTGDFSNTELNIEGYPDETFLAHVIAAKPHQCTLVPDEPGQLTSDHGWDLTRHLSKVRDVVSRLREAGIRTSIFMDPDEAQIALAPATAADRIELYTEAYAHAPNNTDILQKYVAAARQAVALGLVVNAGHDLNLDNLAGFVAAVPQVVEVSIGHALTVEALEFGFEATVRRYLAILGHV